MKYIARPDELKGWSIHEGVTAKVVAKGERMTALMSIWEAGSLFAPHTHPHEQIGIVTEGEVIFTIAGQDYLAKTGDVYCIPSNVPHGERNEGQVRAVCVECFAPVRDDLLRGKFEMPMVEKT